MHIPDARSELANQCQSRLFENDSDWENPSVIESVGNILEYTFMDTWWYRVEFIYNEWRTNDLRSTGNIKHMHKLTRLRCIYYTT